MEINICEEKNNVTNIKTIVLLNLQKQLETVVDKVQIVLLLQTTTIW